MMHLHQVMEKTAFGFLYDSNAPLSKIPFERVDHQVLPLTIEERNFIFAEVLLENKRILVITTHLAPHAFATKERIAQIKVLCAFIAKVKMPVVLLGDFNCAPESIEFKLLTARGMKPLIAKPTYPVFLPVKKYDHILISAELKPKRARVLPTKLSEHFAVYAEIEV